MKYVIIGLNVGSPVTVIVPVVVDTGNVISVSSNVTNSGVIDVSNESTAAAKLSLIVISGATAHS